MLLAELEVRHSRPIAPTRRVAIGSLYLPCRPAPGPGGLLLAGLVGAFADELGDDLRDRVEQLLDDVEHGRRIVQPRVRYRFQVDTHGLDRSRHTLHGVGERLDLEIDDHANGLPQILAAIYAAGRLARPARPDVFRLMRRATRWQGGPGDELLRYLQRGRSGAVGAGSELWALSVLAFPLGGEPSRSEINQRFRDLVRDAHPDHGGKAEDAGQRILDLTEAKRVLLSVGSEAGQPVV
ncbi:MAG TPA: J domain-containing protein [Acidimicrobiales bacterium]|nr:J domain-containing protein [Acidimicrobiales bacterium]